ncbi:MAG: hypothetical protein WBH69_06415 [Fervidobacterium sp.]
MIQLLDVVRFAWLKSFARVSLRRVNFLVRIIVATYTSDVCMLARIATHLL